MQYSDETKGVYGIVLRGDVEGEKRVKTKKNFHFIPLGRSTIRNQNAINLDGA